MAVDDVADADAQQPGRIALALSGGGSRAMAFHLGCLRALKAAGILDKLQAGVPGAGEWLLPVVVSQQEYVGAGRQGRRESAPAHDFGKCPAD